MYCQIRRSLGLFTQYRVQDDILNNKYIYINIYKYNVEDIRNLLCVLGYYTQQILFLVRHINLIGCRTLSLENYSGIIP